MNRKYKFKKAILQAANKEACAHPMFARMERHAERLANNPEEQRIRREAKLETLRMLRPAFTISFVLVVAAWTALTIYVPGLVSVPDAVVGASLCIAFLAFIRASI